MGFGGDTLNTAIYLARLGIDVDYVSALGDDDMSGWMLEQWRAEGVGCNLVDRIENTVPDHRLRRDVKVAHLMRGALLKPP